MLNYEKKIVCSLLIHSITVTVVFAAPFSVEKDNVGISTSPQVTLEQKFSPNLSRNKLERRPRQEEDDDDDQSVLERITKGFNRVITNAVKGTVSVVFGTQDEEGDVEDGIVGNFVKSPFAKPLNALFQSGVNRLTGTTKKPIKSNVTKIAIPTPRATTKKTTNELVENEEDNEDEEQEEDD